MLCMGLRKTKRCIGPMHYNPRSYTEEFVLSGIDKKRMDRIERSMSLIPGRVVYDFKMINGEYVDPSVPRSLYIDHLDLEYKI